MITLHPSGRTAVAGTNASLTVEARATSPLRYRWHLNGIEILEATNATLRIAHVQLAHAGEYRVVVENSLGSATSLAAFLTVLEPVALTQQPQMQKVPPGSTARFTVTASGTPPLEFQWYKEDQPIPGATAASLVLENVASAHSGAYSVQVRNAVNSVRSEPAALAVLRPPPTPARLSNFSRRPDGTVEFTLQGEAGRTYRIEASSDFAVWHTLDSVTAVDATLTFRDVTAAQASIRFYRAVALGSEF